MMEFILDDLDERLAEAVAEMPDGVLLKQLDSLVSNERIGDLEWERAVGVVCSEALLRWRKAVRSPLPFFREGQN